MEFYTTSDKKRPIRLSEQTRRFAYESLNHKYGKETRKTPNVSLDYIEGYDKMSPVEKYDRAVLEIVNNAPIRICENEMLSGAATLGDAIRHKLPADYRGEKRSYYTGVSHLTVDFFEVLEKGIDGIEEKIHMSISNHSDTEKIEFLRSCLHCVKCMKI